MRPSLYGSPPTPWPPFTYTMYLHQGMPLGEEWGGATYFMLETHYDNPALHAPLIDNSGLRIRYTDQVILVSTYSRRHHLPCSYSSLQCYAFLTSRAKMAAAELVDWWVVETLIVKKTEKFEVSAVQL